MFTNSDQNCRFDRLSQIKKTSRIGPQFPLNRKYSKIGQTRRPQIGLDEPVN